ncbi:ribosomal protein S18-alanine N-acetyltransferase [Egbenema bharatensis]|uniref:ribosomal protein S18-alanine N-acetyltransferase n=1 Tax=Egbenema bharatensis TaxID=3463334 RepID=UPI003A8A3947
MNFLALEPLTADLLPAIVELDRLCLGGLWTIDGYRRELESPNSDLLIVKGVGSSSEPLSKQKPGDNGQNPQSQEPLLPPPSSLLSPPSSLLSPPSLLALGCIWSIADEAHITLLGVHPDYRKQGLGQLMLYALLKAAYRRELKWATLEVRVSNQAAIDLYKKFDFQEVGTRKRYYDNQEDALILWLNGLQNPEFRQTLKVWKQQVSDRLEQAGWREKRIKGRI